MNNKRGFTLIELLAVIAIIALIVIIVAPSATRLITGAKRDTQDVQFINVEKALKTYITQNALTLGDTAEVCVSDLKKAGLLEDKKIVNPDTDEEYTGCFSLVWNNEYNQYDYTFSGGGAGHKTYPDYHINPDDDPSGGDDDVSGDENIINDLWNYQITDLASRTAKITGINPNYNSAFANVAYDYENYDEYKADYYLGGSFYDEELLFLKKLVVPGKVRLNSSGQYDPNGMVFSIKRVSFSDGVDLNIAGPMINELIFEDGIEYIDSDFVWDWRNFGDSMGYEFYGDIAATNLETLKLPSSLKKLPSFGCNGSGMPLDIYVPRSVTTINKNTFRRAIFGRYNVYIPSSAQTIEDGAVENLYDVIADNEYDIIYLFTVENETVKTKLINSILNNEDVSPEDEEILRNVIIVDPSAFNY